MANVALDDNRKYVVLGTLSEGNYFILSGDLYIVTEETYDGYYICFNLSDEEKREIDSDTKVLPIPSDKVKIRVEI